MSVAPASVAVASNIETESHPTKKLKLSASAATTSATDDGDDGPSSSGFPVKGKASDQINGRGGVQGTSSTSFSIVQFQGCTHHKRNLNWDHNGKP